MTLLLKLQSLLKTILPLQLTDPDHAAQTLAEHNDQTSSLLGLQDFTGSCCLGYSMER